MVGEGVLLVCLDHPDVQEVLMINRRASGHKHPKLRELIINDFSRLSSAKEQLSRYDACFFCAGVSSIGLNEKTFTERTYDLVVPFAQTCSEASTGMVFIYVSGAGTDSTEKGRVMWARVKGRTENALTKLPFRAQYNFRPGFMKAVKGQKNLLKLYRLFSFLYPAMKWLTPNWACTMEEVGLAMINCVKKGYNSSILEVADIKRQAK